MPGLFLKLAPFERFIVNGVLIANGDRRGTINVIPSTAIVMRESALVTPDLAETDLGRLVMLAQNALLGMIDRNSALFRIKNAKLSVQHDPEGRIANHLADASAAQAQGDLRGVYISLERAFRIEGRPRRS